MKQVRFGTPEFTAQLQATLRQLALLPGNDASTQSYAVDLAMTIILAAFNPHADDPAPFEVVIAAYPAECNQCESATLSIAGTERGEAVVAALAFLHDQAALLHAQPQGSG